MDRDAILASLHFAINSIAAATESVKCADSLPEDIEDEMIISLRSDQGETDLLILKDGTVILSSSQSGVENYNFSQYDLTSAHMSAKPKKLPPRRCPCCKGTGKI